MTFSRGLYSGWMHGVNHQELVTARYGKKRGAFVGHVSKTGKDWVEIDVSKVSVSPGDGLVFDTGGDTNAEQGGRAYAVSGRRITFKRGHIDFDEIERGDRLWKTDDPRLNQRMRKTWQGREPDRAREGLRLRVSGSEGEPLRLADPVRGIEVQSEIPLQIAQRHPLTEEVLAKQLGRLGETNYRLVSVENHTAPGLMLPVSELNRMRRNLVARLEAALRTGASSAVDDAADDVADWTALLPSASVDASDSDAASPRPVLSVLCRNTRQLEAALTFVPDTIYLDFEDVRGYRDAVRLFRSAGCGRRSRLLLATPADPEAGRGGFLQAHRAGRAGRGAHQESRCDSLLS